MIKWLDGSHSWVKRHLKDSSSMRKWILRSDETKNYLFGKNSKCYIWQIQVLLIYGLIPSLWWSRVVPTSCCSCASQWEGLGVWPVMRDEVIQRFLKKTYSRVHTTPDWGNTGVTWGQVSKCPWLAKPKPKDWNSTEMVARSIVRSEKDSS